MWNLLKITKNTKIQWYCTLKKITQYIVNWRLLIHHFELLKLFVELWMFTTWNILGCIMYKRILNASIILLGDFNLPSITWSNPLLSPSVANPTNVFVDFVKRNAMHQLVCDNTRPNSNDPEKGTCIDLVITNGIFAISDLSITNNFSTSDHLSVPFKISTSIPTYSIPTSRYDFTKADWSAINNLLFCIDWQTAFTKCSDVPAQFNLRNDNLTKIIRLFIPIKTHYNNSGGGVNKYPLHIRKLLFKKRFAWRYI